MDDAAAVTSATTATLPPLLRSAKLFTVAGRMIVTVLELAAEGAVATTQAPPLAGGIAVLARGGVRLAATVAWVDGRRFGLCFDDLLDEGAIDRFAGTPRDVPVRLPPLLLDEADRADA